MNDDLKTKLMAAAKQRLSDASEVYQRANRYVSILLKDSGVSPEEFESFCKEQSKRKQPAQ